MYCKICGAALNPGDVFCRNCGASNTNNQPNQGMQPNVQNVQPSMNNQPEFSHQNVNLNDQFNSNNQINSNNQPNNQYQSMEFVEPVSPMNNYPQPTPPAGPAYQQPTPSVQPMPNVQPNIPTPPVNNNYPQPMNQNNNSNKSNKSNGTILMIIGIIVGILAIAIVGYLVYTTLTDKNVNNGTTIVSKKNYNVYFAKHKFTFENDDVATPSSDQLEVTTNNYIALILMTDEISSEMLNTSTVTAFKQQFASEGMQTGDVKSSTYAGLTYWKFNVIKAGAKGTLLLVPKSNGGIWIVLVTNRSNITTYPTDSTVNSALELIKSATFSTSSSIKTDIDFNFSTIDFDSIIKSDSQESAE